MKDWTTYLQPAATALVALSLGFISVNQYRTTNARFNCAQILGTNEETRKDLAKLGLPKDGSWRNISGYCRAFVNPVNSGGGGSSIDFPSEISVKVTDMPYVSVGGQVGITGSVSTY